MKSATQQAPHPTLALAEQVLAPTYARPDRLFVAGQGSSLFDAQGRRYLDMTSGVAVNALGHGSPVIREAMRDAAEGLVHTSNLFHTEPAVRLASLLVAHSFADRVFFCNSGAESVEAALKFARVHGGRDRRKVVAFKGSFHGRTIGALSVTDMPAHHTRFGRPPDRVLAPFDDPSALTWIDPFTSAVIVEPIQGEGGVREPDPRWLTSLRARCDQVGALLIFDEVQTGLGRTGRLWAYEWSGVTPDLLTVAKPLAGGLPMGAVLMTEQVAASLAPGQHATTFGGGPFVASVASRVVEHLCDPAFLADVRARALHLRERLSALEALDVTELRGRGLLIGLRLEMPGVEAPAKKVVGAALERGLLLVAAREDVVRLLPPLLATRDELDQAVDLLALSLRDVAEAYR